MTALAPVLAVVALAAAAAQGATGEGWPQWLGPTRDGRASASAGAPGTRLALAWKRPLGRGTAGIAIAGDRAFTLFADEESEYAVALRLADGSELWRARLDAALPAAEAGPASTPLVDGGRVVTLSSACHLRALDAASGRVVWQRDLKADFGANLRRGCATSPLLEAGQLMVQPGGRENDQRVVAVDPATGRTLWSARGPERTSYTSPVAAEIGGTRQLVVHHTVFGQPAASGLMGMRISDRAVLWSLPLEKMSFDTPVVLSAGGGEATVVLGSWSDTSAVRVSAEGGRFTTRALWRTADLVSYVSPPVSHGGHLYGFGGDFLACVEAATGRTAWKERLYPGSVILVGDRLVVLSVTAGLLRLVRATPAGYREVARLDVLTRGARADTPPSYAAGHVLVRNDEEVAAVRIAH